MYRIRNLIIIMFICVFVLSISDVYAQLTSGYVANDQNWPRKTRKKKKEKDENKGFFFGGNLGGGYGNGWSINVGASGGYQFNSKIRTIGGIEYSYVDQERVVIFGGGAGVSNINYSSIGPFVAGQYLISSNFIGHAEYQYNRFSFEGNSANEDLLLIGPGYVTNFGRGSGVSFSMLYNILYDDETSFYSSAWIPRFGFLYGI